MVIPAAILSLSSPERMKQIKVVSDWYAISELVGNNNTPCMIGHPAKSAVVRSIFPFYGIHMGGGDGMKFASITPIMAPNDAADTPMKKDVERLNLLLTCGSWRQDSPVFQLPQLLGKFGIRSLTARSGEEAVKMIETSDIHIAIVDLSIPLSIDSIDKRPGGERVLQLLSRLKPQPPTIVMRPRQATARENARSLARSLHEGAFTVVDRPAVLETLLDALQRVLRRHYADRWPRGGWKQ
jgi:CheY-like chemotaxis protein